MTLKEMKLRKTELGLTNEEISKRSGVPLGTVQKVFAGITKAPRYDTLMALEKVLSPNTFTVREASTEYIAGSAAPSAGSAAASAVSSARTPAGSAGTSSRAHTRVNGAAAARIYGPGTGNVWDRQGEYTLEDYYALPDEKRVELIDGVFYDMSSPRNDHQLISGQLHAMLLSYITSKGGSCIPFIAPCDVNLDRDEWTMVQPDVMVICDRENILTRTISGAPDLAIEVLSPSTRKKDMILKLHKYSEAGVREYWIVDPQTERIVVYCFDADDFARFYSFDDKIPVGIFDGDCVIDFKIIKDYIAFLKYARDPEKKR